METAVALISIVDIYNGREATVRVVDISSHSLPISKNTVVVQT